MPGRARPIYVNGKDQITIYMLGRTYLDDSLSQVEPPGSRTELPFWDYSKASTRPPRRCLKHMHAYSELKHCSEHAVLFSPLLPIIIAMSFPVMSPYSRYRRSSPSTRSPPGCQNTSPLITSVCISVEVSCVKQVHSWSYDRRNHFRTDGI